MAKSAKGEGDKESEPLRLHRTVDVPQANRLENVRQLAAAVRDGVHHPAALQELLDVDARHFAYYRQAAAILGVLAEQSDGELSLTDSGRHLLATRERSPEERACFRSLIENARALKPFSSFFRGEATPVEEIAHRLGVMAGLAHSTALRRAQTLFQWRRYTDGVPQDNGTAPALPDTSSQVDGLVARHNALAKQIYLERLLALSPKEFEDVVGRLVTAMGFQNVEVVGGAGDGGVDVRAQRMDDWGQQIPVLLQVKRYRKPVGRRVVDELLGVLHRNRQPHGVLVTTSEFTAQALEASNGETTLRLVNGAQLVDLMLKHGVGVRRGRYGEILFD